MPNPKLAGCALCAGLAMLCSAASHGQDFPNRPIRIVTSAPGGGDDFALRVLSQALPPRLGQPVLVDNRGGSVTVSAEFVAKAPPDGYTLILYGSNFWIWPLIRANVRYDPIKDFLPVTMVVTSPHVVVVHPTLPVKSVKDLIALAKARPGALNYDGVVGGSAHIAAEIFKYMAGVNMQFINYKGGEQALLAVVTGEAQLMFPTAGSSTPFLKSGRLKALAITWPQPSPLFPGVPTVAATGLPGYEAASRLAVFAPAKTPGAVIARLNQEIVRALDRPDVKERFRNSGIETVGNTPEQLLADVKAEMDRVGKVVKEGGIKVE